MGKIDVRKFGYMYAWSFRNWVLVNIEKKEDYLLLGVYIEYSSHCYKNEL